MRIKSLILNNFKQHKGLNFTPDPDKVIYATVGPNGVGKTSLQQAIQYAITGECPDNVITAGTNEMSVDCVLEGGTAFTRGKNERGSFQKLHGKTLTGIRLREQIERACDAPTDTLKLALSTELIDNLKPEQLSDFLRTYIPEELTADDVVNHSGVTDPDLSAFLKALFPSGKFGTDTIDEVYANVIESRKSHRHVLEEKKSIIASCIYDRPVESLEDVQKKIEQVIKDEGAVEASKVALSTYEKAVEGKKKQEALIATIEKQIAESTATRPNPATLKAIEDERKKLNEQLIDLNSSIKSMNEQIKYLNDLIPKLASCFCPLSEDITCKNAEDKKALKDEYLEEIEANKQGIEMKQKEINSVNEKLAELTKQESDYRSNERDYQILITRKKNLEDAKKAIPTLPAKPVEIDPDTRDFAEEKRALELLRTKILKCDERDKVQEEYNDIYKIWDNEDKVVKLLAPKGAVLSSIMIHYLNVFEDICNDRAETLKPGFSLKFESDNGIKVLCETSAGKGYIPYESTSSGERAYVLFLLMDLINTLTGVNVIMIDDLDKLDKDAFDALIELLVSPAISKTYDHIFISAVNHTDTLETLKKYPEIELHEM